MFNILRRWRGNMRPDIFVKPACFDTIGNAYALMGAIRGPDTHGTISDQLKHSITARIRWIVFGTTSLFGDVTTKALDRDELTMIATRLLEIKNNKPLAMHHYTSHLLNALRVPSIQDHEVWGVHIVELTEMVRVAYYETC